MGRPDRARPARTGRAGRAGSRRSPRPGASARSPSTSSCLEAEQLGGVSGQRDLVGTSRVPPRVEAQRDLVERPARRLVAQVERGHRTGHGHLLVGDHVDGADLVPDGGDVGAQRRVGAGERDDRAGRAERGVGVEGRGVCRGAQPDDRGGDGHHQHEHDEEVAAPLPPEQPPSPPDHGPARRLLRRRLASAYRPGPSAASTLMGWGRAATRDPAPGSSGRRPDRPSGTPPGPPTTPAARHG